MLQNVELLPGEKCDESEDPPWEENIDFIKDFPHP